MSAIEVKDVPANIDEMLKAVEGGEVIEIVRNGKSVAHLSPRSQIKKASAQKPKFPDLSAFRASIAMKGKPMSETVADLRQQERY